MKKRKIVKDRESQREREREREGERESGKNELVGDRKRDKQNKAFAPVSSSRRHCFLFAVCWKFIGCRRLAESCQPPTHRKLVLERTRYRRNVCMRTGT
jgi:hypothetical protein